MTAMRSRFSAPDICAGRTIVLTATVLPRHSPRHTCKQAVTGGREQGRLLNACQQIKTGADFVHRAGHQHKLCRAERRASAQHTTATDTTQIAVAPDCQHTARSSTLPNVPSSSSSDSVTSSAPLEVPLVCWTTPISRRMSSMRAGGQQQQQHTGRRQQQSAARRATIACSLCLQAGRRRARAHRHCAS